MASDKSIRRGLSVSNEAVGAFIDAVYAIAVTILALEIPAELDAQTSLVHLGDLLISYVSSFSLLFALWLQHRRINVYIDRYRPTGLWLNAAVLMIVCLIPRATTLVFEHGGDVTLIQLLRASEAGNWTLAQVIDVAFFGLVILADVILVWLLFLTPTEVRLADAADIARSKLTISILLVLIFMSSFLFPVPNRIFLMIVPLVLMLEHRIAALVK